MTMPTALRRLEALVETALKLVRTAPSGRLGLARLADAIEAEWLPEPWRSELPGELRAAREATCVPLSTISSPPFSIVTWLAEAAFSISAMPPFLMTTPSASPPDCVT